MTKQLRQISIRARLLALAAVAATALQGLSGLRLASQWKQSTLTRSLLDGTLTGERRLAQAQSALGNTRRFEKDLFFNLANDDDFKRYRASWAKSVTGVLARIDEAAPLLDDSDKPALDRLRSGIAG